MKQAPTTVKISFDNGERHVQMIIDDLAAVAEVAAGLAGTPETAQLISTITQLADAALAGYADAATVEINAANIEQLQLRVELLPPDAAQP